MDSIIRNNLKASYDKENVHQFSERSRPLLIMMAEKISINKINAEW